MEGNGPLRLSLLKSPDFDAGFSEKSLDDFDKGAAFSLISAGDEALEFLEPVLDQDHLGDRRRRPLLELHHQESLPIEG